jgi:hypothetical protein
MYACSAVWALSISVSSWLTGWMRAISVTAAWW